MGPTRNSGAIKEAALRIARFIAVGIVFGSLSFSGVLAQESTGSDGETATDDVVDAAADVEGGESSTDAMDWDATGSEDGESSEELSSDVIDAAEDESVGGGALQEGVDGPSGCQVAFGATTSPVPPALLGLFVVLAHIRRRRRRGSARRIHA